MFNYSVRFEENYDIPKNKITNFPSKFRPEILLYFLVDPPYKCYKFITNEHFTIEVDMVIFWYIFKNGSASDLTLAVCETTDEETHTKNLQMILQEKGISSQLNSTISTITIFNSTFDTLVTIAKLPVKYSLILTGGGPDGEVCSSPAKKSDDQNKSFTEM